MKRGSMKYFLSMLSLLFLFITSSLVYADTKVYFSPNGGSQDMVISEIGKAHKTLDVAMYDLTSKAIAHAILQAKERGVKIEIVLDKAQIKNRSSKSKSLIGKGINIKFHLGQGLMHDKFAVIDDQIILTGSFNWTIAADKKNNENLLVLTDKSLAEKYTKQFKQLWSQSGVGGFKDDRTEGDE